MMAIQLHGHTGPSHLAVKVVIDTDRSIGDTRGHGFAMTTRQALAA